MLNKFQLIGFVGFDPKVTVKDGRTSVFFTLATTERWKKDGEEKEKTDWHPITIYGKLAESIAEKHWVSKGSFLFLEGRIRQHSSKNEDGSFVNSTSFVVDQLRKLRKDEGSDSFSNGSDSSSDVSDDDIPF